MRSLTTPTVGMTGDVELWNGDRDVSPTNNSDVEKIDTSSTEKNFDKHFGEAPEKEVESIDFAEVGLVDFGEDIFNSYIQSRSHDAHVLSQPSTKKLSRRLCFLLRWGAPSFSLPMTQDGYVNAQHLREIPAFSNCSDEWLRGIAKRDTKKRFGIQEDGEGMLRIRANHGHGIPGVEVVERELLLTDAVAYVVHVTDYAAWSLIRYEGLKRGRRGHVHFVARAPAIDEEVAGVRKGGEVCVFVDAHRAMRCGIRFCVSPSRVIISPGNEEGIIPAEFIVKAIDRRSGSQIFPADTSGPLKTPTGKQKVDVMSLHAFDSDNSYFT